MTLVTTSRKPFPELRSLAKDFAFAAGGKYLVRGKAGLSEIISHDSNIIIFSLYHGTVLSFTLYTGGVPGTLLLASDLRTVQREGPRMGIQVNDPSIYERLVPYIPVKLSEDGVESCIFDGTRSRRYLLSLKIHEA
jgi:U3 small nucleolar ribonucleoprotein protein IMP4